MRLPRPAFKTAVGIRFRTAAAEPPNRPRLLHACRLALLLAFFGFSPLRADVFWRIPTRADTALQELGGASVYTTDVQINGAPGTLSTYMFAASAAQVSAGLARRFGLSPADSWGGSFIQCSEKGRVTRFLVLPSAAGEEACVALSISQTARDAARSRQKPPAWPEGMPAFAATPIFSAVCAVTRTAFVTAELEASPEAAVQEAANALLQSGWSDTGPSTPSFRIFASGRKTCLLLAAHNGKTQRTTISVLQREGSTP